MVKQQSTLFDVPEDGNYASGSSLTSVEDPFTDAFGATNMAQGFPTEVQQSVQFLDPYTKEQTVQLMADARSAASDPINIPTQQVAGFNPDQTRGFDLANAGIGGYQPFLDRSSDVYDQALGQYGPQGASLEEGLDLTRRAVDPTTGAINRAAGSAREFDPSSQIDPYFSPYTQNVIDTSLAEINRQSDIEARGIGANAVRSGAFGGSRHGIAEAEHLRNTADKRNQFLATMNDRNYSQALQASMGENARVSEAERGIASLTGDLGKNYGQIGGQVANIGSEYGNMAQGQAGIAQGLGQLGQLGTSLNVQDINTISQTGGLQRQASQAELDAGYQQDIQQQYDPYQRVSFVSDILRGTPSGGQTLSVASAPLPNPFSQSLGAGLATAGLFAPKK